MAHCNCINATNKKFIHFISIPHQIEVKTSSQTISSENIWLPVSSKLITSYKQAGNCISPEVQIIFYRFIIYTVYVRFEAYWKGFETDSNFHDCNCNLTVKLEGDASKIIVRLLSELLDDWKMPLTWHSY